MLYWKWWCMTVVLVLRRLRQEVQYQPWLHGKNLSQKSNQIKPKPQNNSSPNPKNKYHVVYWPFQVSLVSVCHHLIQPHPYYYTCRMSFSLSCHLSSYFTVQTHISCPSWSCHWQEEMNSHDCFRPVIKKRTPSSSKQLMGVGVGWGGA